MPDINIIVDSAIGTCATYIDKIIDVAGITDDVTTVADEDNLPKIINVSDNMDEVYSVGQYIEPVYLDLSAIETCANETYSANITAVAGNSTNINAVASNSTNINAVAGNSTNINAVKTNETNINKVAAINTDVTKVANIDSDVSKVATIDDDITTLTDSEATHLTDIATVAGIATDVSAVASIDDDIETLAGDSGVHLANIATVADINDDVTKVASVYTSVPTVASVYSSIPTVAGASSAITTCANPTNLGYITTCANSTNLGYITDCATNLTPITTCATHIDEITNALAYSNSAAVSASSALISANTATQQANLAKQYAEEAHGQSDVMVENVRAIPAYENYEYTQTETKGLTDLKKFNRSTFDKSKFNDTSTTTITDDGIASGFSSSNRLHFVVDLSNAEKYTIEGCFTYKNTGAEQIILFNGSFYRWFITSDGNIQWRCPNNGNNYWIVVGTVNASNAGITDGTKVWLKTEYIGSTTRKMYYSLNGTDYTLVDTATTNNRNTFSLNAIYIGSSYIGGEPFAGTFNLKSLAVTVDDVEVFNGNKNGIDVIKADNFTKTGSPTVSTDGIASGFLASNYLSGSVSISANSSYSVKGSFKTGTLSASEFIFALANGTTNVLSLYINYTNDVYKLSFIYPYGGFVFGTSLNLTDNTTYNYEVAVIGANLKLYVDGTQVGNFDTFPNTAVDTVVFGVGANGTSAPFSSGSIDLNDFQIISGGLIYQPLLRIPYNHTKTGLKISSRRNRVQDMYNQYGWANYFTLSDTDFTVPYGENLDGHVTKVDWYKNGITTWEYDTNLDCIETGSCTSGTAVTLPKPMADDTYSLSVPYSAKSKTGFTPSATVDYIAKGKVVLG